MEIKRKNYTVKVSEPELYVDNQSRGRSGHMTHAMVEFAPGKILDFNSNCSAVIYEGHSAFGWVEYRISEDGGNTFSEPRDFPYSKQKFYDGTNTVSVEKAVVCNDGRIVAFCLRNNLRELAEPWDTPMVVMSFDGGETWTEAKEFSPYRGRIYDALYHNGVIYVIEFCNDATVSFFGNKEEHVYRLYTSCDNGDTFEELCVVPTDTMGRSYASLLFDANGCLHLYTYNEKNEHNPDHLISEDNGKTWEHAGVCHLAKGSRNPQTAVIDGVYVLHCRAEEINRNKLVLYTSTDAVTWDEGTFIDETAYGTCFYSNNLLLRDEKGKEKLLLQYSHSYLEKRVNIRHMWLEIER